jgi:hypothetical protein
MVVGVLLVIDLAIMTTWQVTDPFYRETKQMEPYVSFQKLISVTVSESRISGTFLFPLHTFITCHSVTETSAYVHL